jgi:hypothetical protein
MRGRHRLAVVSGVLGLLLAPALSGCGGSAEPQPLPRPTASLSPSSASPSPSPPVLPTAAKKKTEAGARATVQHFLDALNFSGAAGDTKALRAAYTKTCTRCEGIADGIDKTYAAGGYYKGGDWLARKVVFYKIDGDVAILDGHIDYTPQTWVKRKDAVPTEFKASKNHLHAFQLKWLQGEGWRVGALDPQL